MASKKISAEKTKQLSLFDLQALGFARFGCFAPREPVTENLDPESIVDIVHAPDTLSSALDRINRGSMTYEEFHTLHGGGSYDYDSTEDIGDDFDEGEYYVDKDRDSVDRRGKYYDKDKESRILAAESKNENKGDTGSHKASKSSKVDREPDKSHQGDDKGDDK